MAIKKIKYLLDAAQDGKYVRSWRERREIVVQVWLEKGRPDGEPDGDFSYSGVLGAVTAVAQGVLDAEQSKKYGG